MRRISWSALAVAATLCAAAPLRAQLIEPTERFRFGLGAGITQPIGDFGNSDKMGVNLLGIFEWPLANSPLYLRADGVYSSTGHDVTDGNTGILGGTVSALYHFSAPRATARPYLLGGVGFYNVDFNPGSETKIGYAFGGGVTFNLSGFTAFAEGRYVSVQTSATSTAFIPLTVGLMFGY